MNSNDTNLQMVRDCMDCSSLLTRWEKDRMPEWKERLQDYSPRPLTKKQEDCLEKIWEKVNCN